MPSSTLIFKKLNTKTQFPYILINAAQDSNNQNPQGTDDYACFVIVIN